MKFHYLNKLYRHLFYLKKNAVENSHIIIIDGNFFKELINQNISAQKFILEITQSKLSEVLWVLEQVVFFNLDYRLSDYLINQYYLKNSDKISITHEIIANDLGSSREVISRMLKRFEKDNIVKVSRGCVKIIDIEKLQAIIDQN